MKKLKLILLIIFFAIIFRGVDLVRATVVQASDSLSDDLACYCLVEEKITYIPITTQTKCEEYAQASGDFNGMEISQCIWSKQESLDDEPENLLGSVSGINKLNQLGMTDAKVLIGRIIKTAMGVMGSIFLLLMVYAGVLWMIGSTSIGGGATKKDVMKARGIIVWSTLGIIVILASYAIVDFIFKIF